MKTKLLRIIDLWRQRDDRYRYIVMLELLKSIKGELITRNFPYAFLKGILGCVRAGPVKDLGKLGAFMIPSPNGDEHEESDEVGVTSHWYPFKPIPNVRQFEVELNAYDPLFAMFGIKKRFSPNIKFENYKNHRYNRYMDHCLKRLEKARIGKIAFEADYSSRQEFLDSTYEFVIKRKGYLMKQRRTHPNPELYFRIVTSLLKYSRVFFVRQLMITEPKWHREISYYKIMGGGKTYRRIAKEASRYYYTTDKGGKNIPKVKYHRTYIPKANGKLRPLGVPSHPGRIYLGLGNKFLLKGLEGKIDQHQHAYQPNKSVITVGQDIMENIINKRNIYSGDLVQYFDKVDLTACLESLKNFDVPGRICFCLRRMHQSLPSNMGRNLSADPLKSNKNTRLYYNISPKASGDWGIKGKHLIMEILENKQTPKAERIKKAVELTKEIRENSKTAGTANDTNTLMMKAINEAQQAVSGKGIPQGGNLSPLLAIILQESEYFPQLKAQGAAYVQYSDDVIVASDEDSGIPNLSIESQGIYESKEKSFGVRKNGQGLKPLDFCGLRYDGVLNRIIANTRSGSRLELKDVDGLVPLLAYRDGIPDELKMNQTKDSYPGSKLSRDDSFEPLPLGTKTYLDRKGISPENVVKHTIGGLLQSRLFSGSWELADYKQDFRLTAKKGSLVHMHYKHLKLEGVNVFTSTSWAFPVIVEDLGKSRRKYLQRGRLESISKGEK